MIAIAAIAGPTFRQQPAFFSDDTAALAIMVKVTPSMVTEDVQPSRLARTIQKIHDLLVQRRGAKTALIAYAGTSHIVMPMTTDEGIIDHFAGALDPKIMPLDGDDAARALQLADQTIAETGSILWMADSIANEQHDALAAWRKTSRTAVHLLPPLLNGPELSSLTTASKAVDASIVHLTPDDDDVRQLAKVAKFSETSLSGPNERWEENGYWLVPVLALIILPFFRRGWTAHTGA